MNEGLYHGVAAANACERRLDVVAANLANLGAAGFKRRASASESFDALLRGRLERGTRAKATIDFSQGALTQSGNPFDLALSGPGFFAVEGPRGELYTRDGRFHVDQSGVLQTADGLAVAWDGARGTIDPAGRDVQIDGEGVVWQGQQRIGQLRVVDFDAREQLADVGRGYFEAPRNVRAAPAAGVVRQGHVEQANVSAVDEMVELINVQRSFESATKLLSMIDQSYRRLTTPG